MIRICSKEYKCMPGAKLAEGDVCFDNGRCQDSKCLNHCEFYKKLPCLCDGDNIVSSFSLDKHCLYGSLHIFLDA